MKPIPFTFTRRKLLSGGDKKLCKIHPNLAFDGEGKVLLSYTHLLLSGSDVFYGGFICKSTDGGESFGEPIPQTALADTFSEDIRTHYSAAPFYSKYHKRWFGLGCSTLYRDDRHPLLRNGISFGDPIYAELDAERGCFASYKTLNFPFPYAYAVPMGQMLEMDNGDLLIPFYYTDKEQPKARCVTVRYAFTKDGLAVVAVGEPLAANEHKRGLCEPSLERLYGKTYMTIRCDETAYWAFSEDGLRFSELHEWCFDNGEPIGNYNTQQHWMACDDGLFLAYTRRGVHNDHIFRHRAPIFMARFDEERGCLLRDTEVILVPELGARLGNFNAYRANPGESWLITAEWMQNDPLGWDACAAYGSDNSIWWAKVKWE